MSSQSFPPPLSREECFRELFPREPAFRFRQVEAALFQPKWKGWADATTLSKALRDRLSASMPWTDVTPVALLKSAKGDTFKALLKTADGLKFETVLMSNARDQWTVCVSSQIGCAMGCRFCATGAMGLKRSLLADEIMDQLRYWRTFLEEHGDLPSRLSNVVFMGMGEPLNNVENVKRAIAAWTKHTDLGPVHITVSTVGVLVQLEALLADKTWPPVRIAISLHSADQAVREQIVPSTVPDFLTKLADWSHRYADALGNRRHYLTFEYTLISGVNDSLQHAKELARYVSKTAVKKVNVIPLNAVTGKGFSRSDEKSVEAFKAVLLKQGIDVTERRTMGDDIAAACGQLATEKV